ncbi:unnamed protein product [Linum tenue]|uniref:Major facilitator superfamily (MFS) profile domain-containing protein n=1 Tax=Linum tenue TaxID=586396 RepID=A0AAV0N3G8_9ROSI|nr:unnamed protein product [Linum tenue]
MAAAVSGDRSGRAITNPLLEREEEDGYHENCPGCRVDRMKRQQTKTNYLHLSYIWTVSLCTALPIQSLFPFIYFMIKDFHIAEKEEDIGYYAGFVGSSFMIGRALTSFLWGRVADRYGRKPVILIGTLSVVIFSSLFGLSTSFWMAISMRFLLGCFNSLLGIIRAYATEVCKDEHKALALSIVSTSRGVGMIIGPAIGGFFAQETLHIHGKKLNERCDSRNITREDSAEESTVKSDIEEASNIRKPRKANLLRNWPLMSTIIVYCVFSLQEIAYSEIFALWAVSDKSYGGLSFSSQDVGEVLTISGLGLLMFQLLLYPPMERKLGPLMVTRLSAAVSIPLLACFPFIAMLSGLVLHLVVNLASILRNTLSVSLVTGLFILQNDAVAQSERAAANGISLTAMSVFKAFGPAGGGALFSWAQKRQVAAFLPGDQMVFFVLNLVQGIGLILTFKPFLAQPNLPSVASN